MKNRRSLHIVDAVQVKTPCHESWEDMKGDQKSRFCSQCQHSVNNLSEMTREEAANLISSSQGTRLCVRYARNQDGAIQFKPAKTSRAQNWRGASMLFASLLGFLGLQLPLHAENVLQGDVAMPPEEIQELGEMVAQPSPTPTPTETPHPIEQTMGIIAIPEPTPRRHESVTMGRIKMPERE